METIEKQWAIFLWTYGGDVISSLYMMGGGGGIILIPPWRCIGSVQNPTLMF